MSGSCGFLPGGQVPLSNKPPVSDIYSHHDNSMLALVRRYLELLPLDCQPSRQHFALSHASAHFHRNILFRVLCGDAKCTQTHKVSLKECFVNIMCMDCYFFGRYR